MRGVSIRIRASLTARRLSRTKIHIFPNKDIAAAEQKLAALKGITGSNLPIMDGVFSMHDEIGPAARTARGA